MNDNAACKSSCILERRLSRIALSGDLLKLPAIPCYEFCQLDCYLLHLWVGRSTRTRRSWTGSSAQGSANQSLTLITKASFQVGSNNMTGKTQQPAGSKCGLFGCGTTSFSSSSGVSKIARALALKGLFRPGLALTACTFLTPPRENARPLFDISFYLVSPCNFCLTGCELCKISAPRKTSYSILAAAISRYSQWQNLAIVPESPSKALHVMSIALAANVKNPRRCRVREVLRSRSEYYLAPSVQACSSPRLRQARRTDHFVRLSGLSATGSAQQTQGRIVMHSTQ